MKKVALHLGWWSLVAITMGWGVITYGSIGGVSTPATWKRGVIIVGSLAPITALLWPVIRFRRGYRGRQLFEGGARLTLPFLLALVLGVIGLIWMASLFWRMWSAGMW